MLLSYLASGTGWMREDFEAIGAAPFEDRRRDAMLNFRAETVNEMLDLMAHFIDDIASP